MNSNKIVEFLDVYYGWNNISAQIPITQTYISRARIANNERLLSDHYRLIKKLTQIKKKAHLDVFTSFKTSPCTSPVYNVKTSTPS